jgi:hypothetical protein
LIQPAPTLRARNHNRRNKLCAGIPAQREIGVNGRVNQTTRNLPDSVVVSQRGAVTLVRLSRPTKRNAIDAEMIADIERVFSCLPEGTRAVVLEGDGGHFCAGADLALIMEADGAGCCRSHVADSAPSASAACPEMALGIPLHGEGGP